MQIQFATCLWLSYCYSATVSFSFFCFCYDFGFSIFTCFIIENLFCCKCFFHKMHGLVLTLSKTGVLHETLNVVGKNWGIIWNFKCRGKNSGLTVVKKKLIYFGHHILFFGWLHFFKAKFKFNCFKFVEQRQNWKTRTKVKKMLKIWQFWNSVKKLFWFVYFLNYKLLVFQYF